MGLSVGECVRECERERSFFSGACETVCWCSRPLKTGKVEAKRNQKRIEELCLSWGGSVS